MSRIAKNTLMLYFRQAVVLLVNLYIVRVVLNTLGEDDYGLYCVIAGVVTMFAFLGSSMSMASQRFLSFEIGKADFEKLKRTFAVSWIIYVLISIFALLLLESIGLWFLNNKLVMPPERFQAVAWTYQFAIVAFLCTILTTPYTSAVIAHEDMEVFAAMSILDSLLKLGSVFVLQYLSGDKLKLYSLLLCLSTFICLVIYACICKIRYRECRFIFYWDKKLFKEIINFIGWTLFGQLSFVFRNQAVTILLNQMFNPVVVTARTIAMQLSSAIHSFSNNFNIGLYPPIIKSYAAGQKQQTIRYMFLGSRITYFLMLLFSLPLILEMPMILSLWLKNPPEYTVRFSQLAVIDGLINSISLPIMTVARATGNIRFYELLLGNIVLASFFISVVILSFGASPYSVMYISIGVSVLTFFVRLWLVRRLIYFSFIDFFRVVMISSMNVTVLSCVASVIICRMLPESFLFLCAKLGLCVLVTCLSAYFIGVTSNERGMIFKIIHRKQKRSSVSDISE